MVGAGEHKPLALGDQRSPYGPAKRARGLFAGEIGGFHTQSQLETQIIIIFATYSN